MEAAIGAIGSWQGQAESSIAIAAALDLIETPQVPRRPNILEPCAPPDGSLTQRLHHQRRSLVVVCSNLLTKQTSWLVQAEGLDID